MIILKMRDGIFSFYIRSDYSAIRAIAIVENDSIRGFNRSHIYSVERLEYSLDRLQKKDRNTNWRVKAMEHTHTEGVSVRGLPARLEGEEGEEQFWFEGGSDADKRIRVDGGCAGHQGARGTHARWPVTFCNVAAGPLGCDC